jgi:hypothetical protein
MKYALALAAQVVVTVAAILAAQAIVNNSRTVRRIVGPL